MTDLLTPQQIKLFYKRLAIRRALGFLFVTTVWLPLLGLIIYGAYHGLGYEHRTVVMPIAIIAGIFVFLTVAGAVVWRCPVCNGLLDSQKGHPSPWPRPPLVCRHCGKKLE